MRRRAALTFIELLLSLAITSVVALAVASMLLATAQGTESRTELRSLVVKRKTLTGRLDAAVRGSARVLASGSGYLVLWMGDSRADGVPNLSELRRVEWNSVARTLVSYEAPANLAQASDTTYAFNDNFATITAALKGTTNFPAETWASGLTGWTVTINSNQASTATLVRYRLTLAAGEISEDVVGAAALRGR